MYFFFHTSVMQDRVLGMSQLKTAWPMHFLVGPHIHLTCLVWWKRNIWGIEVLFNTFPQGGGGYLARIFHFGELPFLTNSPVCQHV